MLYAAYYILVALLLAAFLPFAIIHILLNPKFLGRYLEQYGIQLPSVPAKRGPRLWLHAVSVGEILSCRPLISAFANNGYEVLISTGTQAGHAAATQRFPGILIFYLPFDHPWILKRFFRRLAPDLLIINEIEIWPALVLSAASRKVPVFLVSGRMPYTDFRRYLLLRFLFRRVLAQYEGLFMQSQQEAIRMRSLCDHPSLQILGSLKFDAPTSGLKPELESLLPDGFLICGASTHRGDERLMLHAFQKLLQQDPTCRLVLAPRSPARASAIVRLASSFRLSCGLYSEGKPCNHLVFILDSIGELPGIYARCDLVIMGGTFSSRTGGHNLIEPALHSKCVLCGPHMENFEEQFQIFRNAGAVWETNAQRLADDLRQLANDRKKPAEIGQRARSVVEENRGAARRIHDAIIASSARVERVAISP